MILIYFTYKIVKSYKGEIDLNWLTYIDIEYAKILSGKNNKNFIYYPDHNLTAVTNGVRFVFRKQAIKTKILFEDEYGRKLYLTDVDIINIMAVAPEEIFSLMQMWLTEYEQNKFHNTFILEIGSKPFEVPLPFPEVNCDNKENLGLIASSTFKSVADFDISYHDLLILISLIVDKENVVSENSVQRKSRQLKKFIILSNFYKSGSYRDELNEKGYPVNIPLENVYYNSNVAKQIDLIFDNLEF
ncbi:hypothetical protein ACL9SP_01450 [Priestia flexa]|uniref:hypothetical protein n=1 Tax=Priestia flexa TaxID=86664 RepID=UPI0039B64362